jgi:hypothetical protein
VARGLVPVDTSSLCQVAAAPIVAAALVTPSLSETLHPRAQATVVQIDNDLLAPGNHDRDYTGGLAVSLPQVGETEGWQPHRWLEPLAGRRAGHEELRSLQIQVMAFTPGNIEAPGVVDGDRPYASLWAITGARMRVRDDQQAAVYAALTIGALGLGVTEAAHRAVHRGTGAVVPQGYAHQVSAGGEPTAKLTFAHRKRLSGGQSSQRGDIWLTLAASAGYLTEGSLGLSGRWGARTTPWWSSTADLADYSPAPDFGILPQRRELYIEGGLRLRLRAYNAFLQGQFRHSDHRLIAAEMEHVIVEARVGISATLAHRWKLSLGLVGQTGETRHGPASRRHAWGSISMAHFF